jgi:hypothetical protein
MDKSFSPQLIANRNTISFTFFTPPSAGFPGTFPERLPRLQRGSRGMVPERSRGTPAYRVSPHTRCEDKPSFNDKKSRMLVPKKIEGWLLPLLIIIKKAALLRGRLIVISAAYLIV